jgi:shikimate dehydrogenase
VTVPSASTRVLALLGSRVTHSLSPLLQNAALSAESRDAVYVALACEDEDLPGLLRGLARAGGGGNVTLPYKAAAARLVEVGTEAVRRTGACNTFWLQAGRIHGDNTDVDGVRAAVRALLGTQATDARVLLLGAGGAAHACVAALELDGAAEVVILNRSAERGVSLASGARGLGARGVSATEEIRGERFDLVINATSLGLEAGDPLPLEPTEEVGVAAALDLVYAREETRWVRAMRASGVPSADGLEMLLQQGAAAYRRWWDAEPPLDAMRSALPRR